MFDLLTALGLGYLAGSFPSAVVVGRLAGRDIFRVGSGNMGAMNTARNIGWTAGAAVFLLDVAKGYVAVALAAALAQLAGGGASETVMPLAAGVGAVAGHAWSAFAGLRGGKALATTFGVALPVYPLPGVYAALLLIALVLLLRRVTLAAVLTMLAYPLLVLAVQAQSGGELQEAFPVLTSVLAIAAIVIVKHLLPRRPPTPGHERPERRSTARRDAE